MEENESVREKNGRKGECESIKGKKRREREKECVCDTQRERERDRKGQRERNGMKKREE